MAQRIVQLDHMTGGRAIFGSGPGALASDAHTLGIDPMTQRDRQDEAIGVIRRLFNGERVTHRSDWFTLQDAALQLLPLQEEMPFAVASQISPSGTAGAQPASTGCGNDHLHRLLAEAVPAALPTQWGLRDLYAKKHGQTVNRKDWRVLLSWHIAETRERAIAEARQGLLRHHNEYVVGTLQRPGANAFKDPDEAHREDRVRRWRLPTTIRHAGRPRRAPQAGEPGSNWQVHGTVVNFVHGRASPENTFRSWDMVARFVIPRIQLAICTKLRESRDFVATSTWRCPDLRHRRRSWP